MPTARLLLPLLLLATAAQTRPAPDPFAGARQVPVTIRPHGPLQHRIDYFRGNDKIGERLFYDNGTLAIECPFANGKPEGTRRQFYPTGELFCETPYHDGLIDGAVQFFAPDGSPLGHSTLKAGTGTLHQFPLPAQGLPEQEIPLRRGIIDGTLREYGNFGDTTSTSLTQYLNGSAEGWSITIDTAGHLLESAYLHNGHVHSMFRRFDPAGAPAPGYPKYYIDNHEVTEPAYRAAAKTDPLLQKSLTDDGRRIANTVL
jgi:antitoxin component YwqK of YwqJK toxin-antitoxin module